MAIIAKSNGDGNDFDPIPAGSYFGRCYSMIHIGTREELIPGKSQSQRMNKVYITWEIPSETIEIDGEDLPRVVGKELTLSMNKKATLRKFLDSWRGKAFTDAEAESFDITKLLGVPALISVIHKTAKSSGNIYVDVTGVASPPKGTKVDKQVNPTFEFNYELFAENPSILDDVPEFLKKKIVESEEYEEVMNQSANAPVEAEEVQAEEVSDDGPLF